MHPIQAPTERSTTFVTQKAIVAQVSGAYISTGMGILQSCKVVEIVSGLNNQVVRKWAKDIYADFFGVLTSLEGMTDDRLDKELESRGGKHPK